MKSKLILYLFTLLLSVQISGQDYRIDKNHSNIQIQVERFGVVDVIGRFKDVDGVIIYDKEEITKTKASAVIKVESYDANNIGGEKAVKSKAFLDEESFPEINFRSKSAIIKNNDNYLIGNLTIHGVTKEIELPFEIKGPLLDLPTKKQSIAFKASIIINRQDYGIKFDAKLPNGTSIVGDNVKITLMILAIEE